MATYDYNISGLFTGGILDPDTYVFAGGNILGNGYITDGDDESDSFEEGDTLTMYSSTVAGDVQVAQGSYAGTVDINGTQYILIDGALGYSAATVVDDPSLISLQGSVFDVADVDADLITVCFAEGTLIAVPGGERPVQELGPGDPVLTADGRVVAAKWVGRRTVHKMFCPRDRFEPVRIRAGALGGGAPHSDLVLTPEHAMFVGGCLVTAGALVNGDSIRYEPAASLPERVTYYHVETEAHDLILANGAASETYINYIERRAFDNHAEYLSLYGEEPSLTEMGHVRISARRQLPRSLRKILDEARAAGAAACDLAV
ncbi:Hint domain-containing protein [Oceanicella sp. SM1341]|uniref:Hint domain-containing protein n=1 Tax=Oceanicella sp. SM1341 TaxID=1548889 RepID=UPI000E48B20F|nr:Hint domain-containing protein [Oceanicella sp. SM1341]